VFPPALKRVRAVVKNLADFDVLPNHVGYNIDHTPTFLNEVANRHAVTVEREHLKVALPLRLGLPSTSRWIFCSSLNTVAGAIGVWS
jgi:hypothetical protein